MKNLFNTKSSFAMALSRCGRVLSLIAIGLMLSAGAWASITVTVKSGGIFGTSGETATMTEVATDVYTYTFTANSLSGTDDAKFQLYKGTTCTSAYNIAQAGGGTYLNINYAQLYGNVIVNNNNDSYWKMSTAPSSGKKYTIQLNYNSNETNMSVIVFESYSLTGSDSYGLNSSEANRTQMNVDGGTYTYEFTAQYDGTQWLKLWDGPGGSGYQAKIGSSGSGSLSIGTEYDVSPLGGSGDYVFSHTKGTTYTIVITVGSTTKFKMIEGSISHVNTAATVRAGAVPVVTPSTGATVSAYLALTGCYNGSAATVGRITAYYAKDATPTVNSDSVVITGTYTAGNTYTLDIPAANLSTGVYHVKFSALNSAEKLSALSDEICFSWTGCTQPSLTAAYNSSKTSSSITAAATVTAAGTCGSISAFGVEYSTNSSCSSATKVPGSTPTVGTAQNIQISGLDANTKYYYRTYATVGGTDYYSEIQNDFTLPTFTTSAVVNSSASATVTGTIETGGGCITSTVSESTGLQISETDDFSTVKESKWFVGSIGTAHSETFTGLTANTTYYYRMRSAFTDGTHQTTYVYSDVQNFTTKNVFTSVTIDATASVCAGSTVTPTKSSDPSEGVTWAFTTSDETVATVNASGVVTGVKAGTATITATASKTGYDSKSATCTVTVVPAMAITSVSLGSNALCVGGTTEISTSGVVYGGAGTLSYSSSDANVATISGTTVTAVGDGTATITATVSGGCGSEVTATTTLTVTAIPTITASAGATICGTGTAQLTATASAGDVKWYAAATGDDLLYTGSPFTTPSISTTTTYYVGAEHNSCVSAERTPVTATVVNAPASVEASYTYNNDDATWGSVFSDGHRELVLRVAYNANYTYYAPVLMNGETEVLNPTVADNHATFGTAYHDDTHYFFPVTLDLPSTTYKFKVRVGCSYDNSTASNELTKTTPAVQMGIAGPLFYQAWGCEAQGSGSGSMTPDSSNPLKWTQELTVNRASSSEEWINDFAVLQRYKRDNAYICVDQTGTEGWDIYDDDEGTQIQYANKVGYAANQTLLPSTDCPFEIKTKTVESQTVKTGNYKLTSTAAAAITNGSKVTITVEMTGYDTYSVSMSVDCTQPTAGFAATGSFSGNFSDSNRGISLSTEVVANSYEWVCCDASGNVITTPSTVSFGTQGASCTATVTLPGTYYFKVKAGCTTADILSEKVTVTVTAPEIGIYGPAFSSGDVCVSAGDGKMSQTDGSLTWTKSYILLSSTDGVNIVQRYKNSDATQCCSTVEGWCYSGGRIYDNYSTVSYTDCENYWGVIRPTTAVGYKTGDRVTLTVTMNAYNNYSVTMTRECSAPTAGFDITGQLNASDGEPWAGTVADGTTSGTGGYFGDSHRTITLTSTVGSGYVYNWECTSDNSANVNWYSGDNNTKTWENAVANISLPGTYTFKQQAKCNGSSTWIDSEVITVVVGWPAMRIDGPLYNGGWHEPLTTGDFTFNTTNNNWTVEFNVHSMTSNGAFRIVQENKVASTTSWAVSNNIFAGSTCGTGCSKSGENFIPDVSGLAVNDKVKVTVTMTGYNTYTVALERICGKPYLHSWTIPTAAVCEGSEQTIIAEFWSDYGNVTSYQWSATAESGWTPAQATTTVYSNTFTAGSSDAQITVTATVNCGESQSATSSTITTNAKPTISLGDAATTYPWEYATITATTTCSTLEWKLYDSANKLLTTGAGSGDNYTFEEVDDDEYQLKGISSSGSSSSTTFTVKVDGESAAGCAATQATKTITVSAKATEECN